MEGITTTQWLLMGLGAYALVLLAVTPLYIAALQGRKRQLKDAGAK